MSVRMNAQFFSMSAWLAEQDAYQDDLPLERERPRRSCGAAAAGFTRSPRKAPGVRSWRVPEAGDRVEHGIFGTGTVCAYENDRHVVRVDFDGKSKSFLFPDAFSCGFLSYGGEAGA